MNIIIKMKITQKTSQENKIKTNKLLNVERMEEGNHDQPPLRKAIIKTDLIELKELRGIRINEGRSIY